MVFVPLAFALTIGGYFNQHLFSGLSEIGAVLPARVIHTAGVTPEESREDLDEKPISPPVNPDPHGKGEGGINKQEQKKNLKHHQ
jgi:hypothetical protein